MEQLRMVEVSGDTLKTQTLWDDDYEYLQQKLEPGSPSKGI